MIDIGSIGRIGTASQVAAAPEKAAPTDPKLLKAAQDFESIFVRQMLKSVEKTTAAGCGTQAAAGQQTYGSMVVDTLSDSISKAGGLGLADVIARSMIAAHPSLKGSEAPKGPLPNLTGNWAASLKPLK
jgi:peptidoglycan hydrolase FlgJ